MNCADCPSPASPSTASRRSSLPISLPTSPHSATTSWQPGALFSTVIAIAIPCRILWGWVGSFHVAPRLVMSGLAFGMATSVVLTGVITAGWSALAIGLVAGALSATAMSWHGILLSESARLAPVGRAGSVTGGVLSFGQMGAFLCPSIFSLLLRATGGYAAGWMACAIPAALVGVNLLRREPGRARGRHRMTESEP